MPRLPDSGGDDQPAPESSGRVVGASRTVRSVSVATDWQAIGGTRAGIPQGAPQTRAARMAERVGDKRERRQDGDAERATGGTPAGVPPDGRSIKLRLSGARA